MAQATAASPANESPATTRAHMRALFARVAEQCDLPPLPAVAMRAMNLVRDPEATADGLAQVVSTDAAIAARVLRMSHSAMYLRRTPPQTLQEAILTVGFDVLRKILIAASARSAYDGKDARAETLWAHALTTALAADELAVRDGERRGGVSFVAGLLHDIGKLVFHLSDKAAFAALPHYDEARENGLYGVTHAAIGGCLAERWGLDDAIVEAVMFHHRGAMSPLAARLERADRLAHQIGHGSVAGPVADEDPALIEVGACVLATFERERALFC